MASGPMSALVTKPARKVPPYFGVVSFPSARIFGLPELLAWLVLLLDVASVVVEANRMAISSIDRMCLLTVYQLYYDLSSYL